MPADSGKLSAPKGGRIREAVAGSGITYAESRIAGTRRALCRVKNFSRWGPLENNRVGELPSRCMGFSVEIAEGTQNQGNQDPTIQLTSLN